MAVSNSLSDYLQLSSAGAGSPLDLEPSMNFDQKMLSQQAELKRQKI